MNTKFIFVSPVPIDQKTTHYYQTIYGRLRKIILNKVLSSVLKITLTKSVRVPYATQKGLTMHYKMK